MKLVRLIAATILVVSASQGPAAAKGPGLIGPGDVEGVVSTLKGPPAKGSDVDRADLERLKVLQAASASKASIDAAYGDRKETLAGFAKGTGIGLDKRGAPKTAKLIKLVATEVEAVLSDVKQRWSRERPFAVEAQLLRCPGKPSSNSYPSSHAAFGAAAAVVLAELSPRNAAQLQARGVSYGESRLVCGYHYPSDVEAGRAVGAAVGKALLASPAFKRELEKARAEIGAGR